MSKTVTLDRAVVETLVNFLGKLPVETGIAPIHGLLFNVLNAPVEPVQAAVMPKKETKKAGKKPGKNLPKSKDAVAEFMLNNPLARKEDLIAYLMNRGFTAGTAKNVASTHFKSAA